jgi:hypothetical protein
VSLETAQYINSLDATNPTGLDSRTTADDHLRLLKASLKRTFINIASEVAATDTQMNYLMGLTSTAQDQLNTLYTGKMANSATAAFAISASYALSASAATNATSAVFATSASSAASAAYAYSSTNATSAVFATSASSAASAAYAFSTTNATSAVYAFSANAAASAQR